MFTSNVTAALHEAYSKLPPSDQEACARVTAIAAAAITTTCAGCCISLYGKIRWLEGENAGIRDQFSKLQKQNNDLSQKIQSLTNPNVQTMNRDDKKNV